MDRKLSKDQVSNNSNNNNNNGNSDRAPCTTSENAETRAVASSQEEERAREICMNDENQPNGDILLEDDTHVPNNIHTRRMFWQMELVDQLFPNTNSVQIGNMPTEKNIAGTIIRTELTEAAITARDEADAQVGGSRPANIDRGNNSIVVQPPSLNGECGQLGDATVEEQLADLESIFGQKVNAYVTTADSILHTQAELDE